jgi:hypothetical protein
METLVPGRDCGMCKACCIIPAIDTPEMQKLPASACRHCAASPCDIYETRPQVCRKYYCGWRRLGNLGDDWRPDKSGVLIESGNVPSPAGPSPSISLILTGNPLKTIRQRSFIDFVISGVNKNLLLTMSLPGPAGTLGGTFRLNTPEIRTACHQSSRSHVRLELERALALLAAHECPPYKMEHIGNDVSS